MIAPRLHGGARRRIAATAACLTFVLFSATTPVVLAHDFWIEPSSFRPQPGAAVEVRLRVGDGFRGDTLPRDPHHLERFLVVDSRGARPIAGRAGLEPAGAFRVTAAGPHVIAYRSRPTFVELDADAFRAYLREKGLESVVVERERRGESSSPGREIFSRCAKSLLATPGAPGSFDRALGLRLEIVAEDDPTTAYLPRSQSFQVRFENVPLANALVVATPAAAPQAARAARTDENGRVRLDLDRPGAWLLATVHMVPAAAGSDADWESVWASLTFERLDR